MSYTKGCDFFMKRYIRSNKVQKIEAPTWEEFLKKIAELTPYSVDYCYRYRDKWDNFFVLLDQDGDTYTGVYEHYEDGSFAIYVDDIEHNSFDPDSPIVFTGVPVQF